MKRLGCLTSKSPAAGTLLALLALVSALVPTAATLAAGSVEAGQQKAVVCAACHAIDGNSLNPEWPTIAEQNEAYIVHSLKAFKSGERYNVLMTSQALALNEQDMADLAAYFASKTRRGGKADPKLVSSGERLYRGGNTDSGIGACIACHGPSGSGNAPAGYPAIGGQHATYTAAQLKLYRASQRCADKPSATPPAPGSEQRCSDPGQMMRNITARLSDAEIEAVSSYIQGLRP